MCQFLERPRAGLVLALHVRSKEAQLHGRWGRRGELVALVIAAVPKEEQEGCVRGQEFRHGADRRLVVGAHPGLQLGEAALADGVATAEADGEDEGGVVARGAHGAAEEVGPHGSLHGNAASVLNNTHSPNRKSLSSPHTRQTDTHTHTRK